MLYCLTTAGINNVTTHKRMLAVNRAMLTGHLAMGSNADPNILLRGALRIAGLLA